MLKALLLISLLLPISGASGQGLTEDRTMVYKHMICYESAYLGKILEEKGLVKNQSLVGIDGLSDKTWLYEFYNDKFKHWVILLTNTVGDSCIIGESVKGPNSETL